MTSTSRFLMIACAVACLFSAAGCQYLKQDMANQPKNKPLSPSDFFTDGRSERPLVENTVAHGAIGNDELFIPKESNAFPLPVNRELLERGQERFKIFCTPCHGLQGDGNGMVAMRGMKHPPSFHQDRLRQEPNGYIYDVDHQRFRRHVRLLCADSSARPLGHHRLSSARCSSAAMPRSPIFPRSSAKN